MKMDWKWKSVLQLIITLILSGGSLGNYCYCECRRTSVTDGCAEYTADPAMFVPTLNRMPNRRYRDPECTFPISNDCSIMQLSDCRHNWNCCRKNAANISCEIELHHARGKCDRDYTCRPDDVCCYKVFCNCTSVLTTNLPDTTTSLETTTSKSQTGTVTPSKSTEDNKITTSKTNPSESQKVSGSTSSSSITTRITTQTHGSQMASGTTLNNAAPEDSSAQSNGMGAGIGIAMCIILAAAAVLLFYCHKRGILQKITNKADKEDKSRKRAPSETYADIDANTYTGAKTVTNLNHGYNTSDKDLPIASGEPAYADVSPNGHMGAGIYMDPQQCENKPQVPSPRNSGYDDLNRLVITGPPNIEAEYADTIQPISSAYQSLKKKSDGYTEPLGMSKDGHAPVKQSRSYPGYEDTILSSNVPIQSAYQSIKRPSNTDMGEAEYMDPEKYTGNQGTPQTAVENPNYDGIGQITIPGSTELAVNKCTRSSDGMGSGVYMDPEKCGNTLTGQKASHAVENPGYEAINKVILPEDNTSTHQPDMGLQKSSQVKPGQQHYQSLKKPEEPYQALKKPEQDPYQTLNKPEQDPYQALKKPEQSHYQSLNKSEQGHYQDLKNPKPEDMGSGDYADPEKYTDVPAFTNKNKEADGNDENNKTEDADDREYFTLEPPNSGDGDSDGAADAANGLDDREYFTLEPPNSGDEGSDGAADAANGLDDREYFILEPPGDDDENVKTGQEEREYSIPPDAQ
ncbi:uncharacterized protein [Amphiura filiformis]|uniref:uncharacterized protein n=1 Tax=Amphiura filiformis TaxID=82378 RepID=UPI003B227E89